MDGTDIIVFNNFFFHFVSSSPPLSLSSFSLPRSSPFSFSFFLSRRMDFHRGCCPREIANRLSSSCFQNIFQGLSSRSIAFRIRRENAINYGNGTERLRPFPASLSPPSPPSSSTAIDEYVVADIRIPQLNTVSTYLNGHLAGSLDLGTRIVASLPLSFADNR